MVGAHAIHASEEEAAVEKELTNRVYKQKSTKKTVAGMLPGIETPMPPKFTDSSIPLSESVLSPAHKEFSSTDQKASWAKPKRPRGRPPKIKTSPEVHPPSSLPASPSPPPPPSPPSSSSSQLVQLPSDVFDPGPSKSQKMQDGQKHRRDKEKMLDTSTRDWIFDGRLPKQKNFVRPKLKQPGYLSPEHEQWFKGRGISRETLARNGVSSEGAAIAFPYYKNKELVNVKFRELPKKFFQSKGGEKILYGYDDVATSGEIIIVEGEMDKLSLNEAGIWNVVSVPNGAPAKVSDNSEVGEIIREADVNFSYLWDCMEIFETKHKIILATDNDGPGQALAEELARRLGKERCWRVLWPRERKREEMTVELLADEGANPLMSPLLTTLAVDVSTSADQGAAPLGDSGFRKDANEVLVKEGPERLYLLVGEAEAIPVAGLYGFDDYRNDILRYYNQDDASELGVTTGWMTLDPYYKVVPGELTIVTGVPNSGKSEWIDSLLTNLARHHHWAFALCSLEKKPRDHAKQLVEKYTGKPFFNYMNHEGRERMTLEELDEALEWIQDHFLVIKHLKDDPPTIEWVLEVARMAVFKHGVRGLVIDPYNELDHSRQNHMSETEQVSNMLSKVKRFAQMYGVHVWFVAHPRQLPNWNGEAPTLYDISGSAHFINKADNGIVVHRVWNKKESTRGSKGKEGGSKWAPAPRQREPADLAPNEVQILVRKVRNKAAGMIGNAVLVYDRPSGRYDDRSDPFDVGEEETHVEKLSQPSLPIQEPPHSHKEKDEAVYDHGFVSLSRSDLFSPTPPLQRPASKTPDYSDEGFFYAADDDQESLYRISDPSPSISKHR